MTRFYLPLERMPSVSLSPHAEERRIQRGMPIHLLRASLQENLDAVENARAQLDRTNERTLLLCGPFAIVLCPDHSIITLYWRLPGAPEGLHHLPTFVESHPILGVQTAFLEASTKDGIDTGAVIETIRDHARVWKAAATLANDKRPLRIAIGPYLLFVSVLYGTPNLISPIRRA